MTFRIGPVAVALGLAAVGALTQVSSAQQWPPGPGMPPNPPAAAANPVCQRLEAQLASVDRGAADPAQADQVRRYEDAQTRQQAELDRMVAQARRAGCDSGFFLFRSDSPQCVEINRQIQNMRGNLDRMTMDLQRLRSGTSDRGEQRRGILMSLGENNCGPQYRQAATGKPNGLFDQIFGSTTSTPNDPSTPTQSTGLTTVCVRTCDGFYFPISYATSPERLRDDERTCQRLCPAAEVQLYSHRNVGEDMNQATSLSGQIYTALPNAFKYRTEFNAACSCRRPGQSWADALGPDTTAQPGDIVVTDERAKQLSAPPGARPPAKSTKAVPAATVPATAATVPAATDPPPTADAAPETPPANRTVRSVGPTFIPTAR